METNTTYFEQTGKENTEKVFQLARRRGEELGIKTMIVASTTGNTAVQAMDALSGFKIVIVTHSYGSYKANEWKFIEENKIIVESRGGIVITAAHAFAGISRAIHFKYNMGFYGDFISDTLRIFGQGIKVCCEISGMAADAGVVQSGEDVIAIGGTGGGSDTAVVIAPANVHRFFDTKIREVICKPRL